MRDGDEINVRVLGSSFAKLVESLLGDWMRKVLMKFEYESSDEDEDLQGQPQCLKKARTVDFPLGLGNCSFEDEGAFEPTSGTGDVSRALGGDQELNS